MTVEWLPLLLTLATGLGYGIKTMIDYWTGSGTKRQDELAKMRAELMQEVQDLRTEIGVLRRQVDTWQARFYEQKIANEVLRRENELLRLDRRALSRENARLAQARLGPLPEPPPPFLAAPDDTAAPDPGAADVSGGDA